MGALQEAIRLHVQLDAFDPPACGLAAGEEGFGEVRLLVKAGKGVPLQAAIAEWLAQFRVPRDLRLAVDIDPQSFL